MRFNSALARWVGGLAFRVRYLLVVFLDDLRHVFGAAVAQLEGVSVEYFMELAGFGEMLVDEV